MFSKYYEDELRYLRDLGREFARAHPAVAYMLDSPGSDPDVERLLEGFAFLSARIRQKLDDELPEVTHGLMALLWPHYLRPIPALTILEFEPYLTAMRGARRIPRGTEVQSIPVDGTACRFQTSQEVVLQPLSLESVRLDTGVGPSRLWLELRIWNQVPVAAMELSQLRFHLHGDPSDSYALYYHLRNHLDGIFLRTGEPGDDAGPRIPLRLSPAGFEEEAALLDYPARSFVGYRLLQEYFTLPQKFLFLDVCDLEALRNLKVTERFWIEILFDRALDPGLRPSRENVRLYCTPASNLFAHEADAFRIDHLSTEYRLRPAGKTVTHYEISSVERVTATMHGRAEAKEIPSFYTFSRTSPDEPGLVYYSVRVKQSVTDGRTDTYLSFVDMAGDNQVPEVETVSVHLKCTNRHLPPGLHVGDVRDRTDKTPEFVRFRNISVPTASVPPPLDGGLHWRLLSHLALNHVSLMDVEALRGILALYNPHAAQDAQSARAHRRRVAGIRRIVGSPSDRLFGGSPIRGTAIQMELRQDHFAGPGDLYLFACVLEEFLALYASINSFTQLTVREVQGGEEYVWPCRIGQKQLL